ncbi:hypothetical protein [Paludisphaera mucosa]|uniref:Uncharacterized protein n=1 Tax=Paludisphaera mucosa TaxID=3030827 RepID=A0ABT6FLU1_9BACT|nr:hypothetical protein [Paludisphaera mucosa]MDG3008527.1 hypothetical protein [Paludisphaera mucosa]
MSTLDEKSLRRPEFTQGFDIRLGDGRQWTFPIANRAFYPEIAPEGGFRVKAAAPYGDDFQRKLERLTLSEEDTPAANEERFDLRLTLAAELLCRNYALDNAALAVLLPFRVNAENGLANPEMWSEVNYVLQGHAPKARTVG